MSTSMRGGVQTWPMAAEAVVASEALPAVAVAKAGPHPNPPPQAGEGVASASGASLPLPPAGEGRGEGKAEAVRVQAPTPAPKSGRTATTAQAAQPAGFASTPADAGALGGTVVALVLVVGLILLLGWLAKRMPGVAGTSNPALRIVGSLALGPRERVVVVEVGGTQLLLSTGAGGTRALHTLEQPLPVATPATSPFAQLLAQQFRQSMGLKAKGSKPA